MRDRKPSPENATDGTPRSKTRKPKTMPLAPAARELGTDAGHAQFAPAEFAAALSNAVAEYTSAVDREATEENHKKAEAFARYVSLLHEQNPGRIDEILNEAHTLGIDAAKVKADYETIAEANRLQSIAATKTETTAEVAKASQGMIDWRAGYDAELARIGAALQNATTPEEASAANLARMSCRDGFIPQATKWQSLINAATNRKNAAENAEQSRRTLMDSNPELFPEHVPTPPPLPTKAHDRDAPPPGYEWRYRGTDRSHTRYAVPIGTREDPMQSP